MRVRSLHLKKTKRSDDVHYTVAPEDSITVPKALGGRVDGVDFKAYTANQTDQGAALDVFVALVPQH